MSINLWKAGGKPTSYSPLPLGAGNNIPLNFIGSYVIKCKARAINGNSNLYFQWDNADRAVEYSVRTLTSVLTEYSWEFTTDRPTSFYLADQSAKGDIIIDSIELVQKPLSKLTINGIDGFKSGKWSLHANASVVDDETLVLNATAGGQESYLKVFVNPNTTYTLTNQNTGATGSTVMIREYSLPSNALINTLPLQNQDDVVYTFTTNSQTAYIYVCLTTNFGGGIYTFKRPMLNLGTTPAPYSKKTSADAKMVMPVPVGNLFDGALESGTINASGVKSAFSGAVRSVNKYSVKPNNSYSLSTTDNTLDWVFFYGLDGTFISGTSGGLTGKKNGTFATPNGCYLIAFTLLGTSLTDKIQLEPGTTATPYKPYAVQVNAKPKRYVPKKNMVPNDVSFWINTTPQTIYTPVYIPVKPNATYSLKVANGYIIGANQRDFNKAFATWTDYLNSRILTTNANVFYLELFVRKADSSNLSPMDVPTIQAQLEEGTTATAYEPYQLILPRANKGLSFNGLNQNFRLPSMKIDVIEIDCKLDNANGVLFQRYGNTSVYQLANGGNPGGMTISRSGALPLNERFKVRYSDFYLEDTPTTFFSNIVDAAFAKGTLYKVTCYLAGSIVAQYDFENPNNIVGDKVLSIADNVVPKKNLFNKATVTASSFIDTTTGNLSVSGAGNTASDWISVNPSTSYVISGLTQFFAGLGIGYYNANKTFISSYSIGSNTAVVTPANTAFMRITVNNVDLQNAQLELGSVSTAYEPYQLITIKRDTKNLIPSFEDARWSLHANTQVLGKDWLRLNATANFQSSRINIPVLPNTTYRFIGNNKFSSNAWEYKADGTYNNVGVVTGYDKVFTTQNNTYILQLELTNGAAGTYDFIKPSLYQLDSKEGTIVGSPAKLNKAPKRTLYTKR